MQPDWPCTWSGECCCQWRWWRCVDNWDSKRSEEMEDSWSWDIPGDREIRSHSKYCHTSKHASSWTDRHPVSSHHLPEMLGHWCPHLKSLVIHSRRTARISSSEIQKTSWTNQSLNLWKMCYRLAKHKTKPLSRTMWACIKAIIMN